MAERIIKVSELCTFLGSAGNRLRLLKGIAQISDNSGSQRSLKIRYLLNCSSHNPGWHLPHSGRCRSHYKKMQGIEP